MEIRILNYFLTVAREENFTRAAKKLHLSQPTLSRQLKDMEEEYGKQLIIRGPRRVTLTDDGILLRKRAEEILSLVEKTENELLSRDDTISGDIRIGAGESENFGFIMQAAQELRKEYPDIHFHIISGDGSSTIDRLDRGLIDFAYAYGDLDPVKYEALPLPVRDRWGVLMRKNDQLAARDFIIPEDLWDKPLLTSRQALSNSTHGDVLKKWLNKPLDKLQFIGSFNLLYNGSLMVREGMGYAIAFDKIINTESSDLCFRPLQPPIYAEPTVVWKKYQVFSKASQKFLDVLKHKVQE